ncbi:MAG: hypothetical protein HYY13_10395 [Nitrospirae bacterium]|nr:hypothetical protein [Nitrospirota bacterium]
MGQVGGNERLMEHSSPYKSLRNLKRWELVELINWCQAQDEEGENVELHVREQGPDKIAIEALTNRDTSTLVVDWESGYADVETHRMSRKDGLRFWSGIVAQALEGKIEKAVHRGYFHCKLCQETVWLSGPTDIQAHLAEHELPVEQVVVGDGIMLKVGEKSVGLEQFLTGEDTPIH